MQTLIFDCDGVLVDSEVIAEATLIERLSEWLQDVDVEQALAQALGQTTEAILLGLEALSAHALPQAALALLDDEIEARLAQELDAIEGAAAAITVVDLTKAVVSNSRRCRVVASLSKTGL